MLARITKAAVTLNSHFKCIIKQYILCCEFILHFTAQSSKFKLAGLKDFLPHLKAQEGQSREL